MKIRDALLSEIENFREDKGLSERQFSLLAIGQPKFVRRLRIGRSTLTSIETVERFIEENKSVPAVELAERLRPNSSVAA